MNDPKFPYDWSVKDLPNTCAGEVFVAHAGAGGSILGWRWSAWNVVGCSETDKRLVPLILNNTGVAATDDIPPLLDVVDGTLTCASDKEEKPFDTYFSFLLKACMSQPKVIIMDAFEEITMGRDKGYCKLFQKILNDAEYDVQLFILNAVTMGVPQFRSRAYFIARRRDCSFPRLKMTFDCPEIAWWQVMRNMHYVPGDDAMPDAVQIPMDKPLSQMSVGNIGKLSCEGKMLSIKAISLACGFPYDYDWGKLKDKQKLFFLWQSALPIMTGNIACKINEQWKLK